MTVISGGSRRRWGGCIPRYRYTTIFASEKYRQSLAYLGGKLLQPEVILDSKCTQKRLTTGLRTGPQLRKRSLHRYPDHLARFKGGHFAAGKHWEGRTGKRRKRVERESSPYTINSWISHWSWLLRCSVGADKSRNQRSVTVMGMARFDVYTDKVGVRRACVLPDTKSSQHVLRLCKAVVD